MDQKEKPIVEFPRHFEIRNRLREIFRIPTIDRKIAARFFAARKKYRTAMRELAKQQNSLDRKMFKAGQPLRPVQEFALDESPLLRAYLDTQKEYRAAKKIFGPKFSREPRSQL